MPISGVGAAILNPIYCSILYKKKIQHFAKKKVKAVCHVFVCHVLAIKSQACLEIA